MSDFKRYFAIEKKDDDKQMVYGWASTNDLDSDGEIISVDALEKALPNYMKFPTIREMHNAKAVGVTKETRVDRGKGLFIGAKIVDKDAWQKVKEGVYRAFSVGGGVVSKVDNVINDLVLNEISLVDRPANSNAVITLFKADTSTDESELRSTQFAHVEKRLLPIHTSDAVQKSMHDFLEIDFESEKERAIVLARIIQACQKMNIDSREFVAYAKMSKMELRQMAMYKTIGFRPIDERRNELFKTIITEAIRMAEDTKDTAVTPTEEVKTPTETTAPVEETPTETKKQETVDDTLSRLEKLEKKAEVKDDKAVDFTKIDSLAKHMEKVVSVLEKLASRVEALESQPAPTKTKAPFAMLDKMNSAEPASGRTAEEESRLKEVQKKLKEYEALRMNNLEKYQEVQVEAFALADEEYRLLSK